MIFCYADACRYNTDGYCDRDQITVGDELECTDYEYYFDTKEYQSEYFRAVEKDGIHYKVRCRGRRAEENGITFFYVDKTLTDVTQIIEEQTGYMMYYKDLWNGFIPDKIKEILAEQENVADLPELEK